MKSEKEAKAATHTPGPWEVRDLAPAFPDVLDITNNGITLASIKREGIFPEEANARLIAASPKMLNALLRIRKALNMNPKAAEDALRDDPQSWDALNAAIESAGGF